MELQASHVPKSKTVSFTLNLPRQASPFGDSFHFEVWLVADDVINEVQVNFGQKFQNVVVSVVVRLEAGKESSLVALAVDHRVSRVTILERIADVNNMNDEFASMSTSPF
jgi:hypothetical protein